MTIPAKECCLCASIIDAHNEPRLSPAVCTALGFLDYWESPEAIQVALGIRRAMDKGRPTHRVVVGQLMDKEYREWLQHPSFNLSLPLSCLDSLVEPLLENYRDKRIARMIATAHWEIAHKKQKAVDAARKLVEELGGVL